MDEPDLFISYASEDKEQFVRPLVAALIRYGLTPWYDEFSLSPGDSLSRTIDKGISHTKYGVVVLSRAFFSKAWPEYELRGLVTREIEGKARIIPIWMGIEKNDVSEYSPPLADKVALVANSTKVDAIAQQLVRIIRPGLYQRYLRALLWARAAQQPSSRTVESLRAFDEILPPEVSLAPLSNDDITVIRLIRAVFLDVFPELLSVWLKTIRGNANPKEEIAWWLMIAAIYMEYVSAKQPQRSDRWHLMRCLVWLGSGRPLAEIADSVQQLGESDMLALKKLLVPDENGELLVLDTPDDVRNHFASTREPRKDC